MFFIYSYFYIFLLFLFTVLYCHYYFFQVLLMQVGAKECLISKQDLQNNDLKVVLERSKILITETNKGMNLDFNFFFIVVISHLKKFTS